jgi:hypothetical protein
MLFRSRPAVHTKSARHLYVTVRPGVSYARSPVRRGERARDDRPWTPEGPLGASLSRTGGGSEMTKRNEHKVTLIMNGYRYIAVEENGVIQLSRDGEPIGKATWTKDQLIYNSALLPDDVSNALEKKIKEQMDKNWEED